MTLPIVLVIAALMFLVLEVFFVSFGILSVIAMALAVFGVMLGFKESDALGWSLLGVMVVGGPAAIWGAFKILPKLPFGRSFQLAPPQARDAARDRAPDHELLGAIGETASPLRPSGRAFFDDHAVVLPQGVAKIGVMVASLRVTENGNHHGNRMPNLLAHLQHAIGAGLDAGV